MILNYWKKILDKYTDVHFESKKSLALSLFAFIIVVGLALFVLSQPERISPFF